MDTQVFFQKIRTYTNLSQEAENAWAGILKEKEYCKGDFLVSIGQIPKKVAFVCEGLFSQYYITNWRERLARAQL